LQSQKNERHREILEILERIPFVTVEYLAEELHISPSSIRRDLSILEARGSVKRSYGGVSLTVTDCLDIPFSMRMKANVAEKKKIAIKAAELVKDGDTVFLDDSSTCMYLAYELVKKRGVTIITNGVHTVHYLADFKTKVICTGGMLDFENRASMTGAETLRQISLMRANFSFFAPQALSEDGLLMDCYRETAAAARQMMLSGESKVALCDSSKVGKNSTFTQCSLGELDYLVCDESLSARYGKRFPRVCYL